MSEIPAEWSLDRLKDVAVINADSLVVDTDPDYEFDYLEISNVDYYGVIDRGAIEHLRYEDAPSRARRRVPNNSIIVSSVRPNLQAVASFDEVGLHLICSTGFNVIEPDGHRLFPRFAYYHLISEASRQYFEATAKGVGYPAVDDKDFDSAGMPLPPLTEQRRIVAYLDASCTAIDAAVTAKRRQMETLEALSRDAIQRALIPGPEQGLDLRDTGNVWLAQIPASWALVSLKRVAVVHTGLTLGKEYEGPLVERPYLRVANVQDGHLDLSDVATIAVPIDVARRVELRVNDVLMTEGGDLDKLGRGSLWNGEIPDCLHQNHIFAVRCFKHKLLPKFLAYLTASQHGRDYFEATGKRTTNLASTSATKVGSFPLPLPSIEEQARIVSDLEERLLQLRAIICNIENQITALLAYRKSLIHECVIGQRRIGKADITAAQEAASLS